MMGVHHGHHVHNVHRGCRLDGGVHAHREVVEEGIGKLKEQDRNALVASVQVMYL